MNENLDIVDFILNGNKVKNPEYNPKTKKGAVQPPYLISNTPKYNSNENLVDMMNEDSGSFSEFGDPEKYAEYGITVSPIRTKEELDKMRAKNQSAMEQLGHFLVQAGYGEVVLGSLEGFGDIVDGVRALFTGNYEPSAYVKYFEEKQQKLRDDFAIYRENPDKSFNFSDFGWWMENAVSAASTLSLMIPAAGWARGLSMAGKLFKIGKGLSMGAKWASRGIAKGIKLGKAANKYSALKSVNNLANKINKSLITGGDIVARATLSRTGEGYMESIGVWDDVYNTAYENLANMPEAEFQKFLANNPEFIENNQPLDKDTIAKYIANKSARRTFINDYAMLLQDVMMLKALGPLWGKGGKRASTASERIAAKNIKQQLAGVEADKLIKDNLYNRAKDIFTYGIKHPTKSIAAMELGEGFEEGYQGIMTEKGMEVASKYFNPNFTPRTLGSYLSDASIWEQAFWGAMGAKIYQGGHNIVKKASDSAIGLYKKNTMTAEQYEQWKTADRKIELENINGTYSNIQDLIQTLDQIENGKNPYKTKKNIKGENIIDEATGQIIQEEVTEDEKNKLKERAIDEFVVNSALNSTDTGTFDLISEILDSQEFNKYIEKNGKGITVNDTKLDKQIRNRMKEVSDLYTLELKNVNDETSGDNPFVVKQVARNIVRNKLQLNNIIDDIAANNDEYLKNKGTENYDGYLENRRYNLYAKSVSKLNNLLNHYKTQYEKGEISKAAYEQHRRNIVNEIQHWNEYATANTAKGAFQDALNKFKTQLNDNNTDIVKAFGDVFNAYKEHENTATPNAATREIIEKGIELERVKTKLESYIPQNQSDYLSLYDEFAIGNDQYSEKKIKEYNDVIKNYLKNAKDLDAAIKDMFNGTAKDNAVNEAMDYFRYGYKPQGDIYSQLMQMSFDQGLDSMIKTERENRKKQEEVKKDAENAGITMPNQPAQNIQTNDNQETKNNNEVQENTQSPQGTQSTQSPQVEQNEYSETKEESPIEEDVEGIVYEDSNGSLADVIDEGVNPFAEEDKAGKDAYIEDYTEEDKNELIYLSEADKYIIITSYKEQGYINEIIEALKNNNDAKLNEFLNRVSKHLIEQGCNEDLAPVYAKRSLFEFINKPIMSKASVLKKLAEQLALGFNQQSAEKLSISALINGEAISEVLDEFLTEYNNVIENPPIGGKYVINLKNLFDYLINDENVDISTAIDIYNNINKFLPTNTEEKYIFVGMEYENNQPLRAEDFINKIRSYKSDDTIHYDDTHIYLIDEKYRDQKFFDTLVQVANGNKTFAKLEKSEGGETNVSIYGEYKDGKNTEQVKIGILRCVYFSPDGNSISPTTHYSGFRNSMFIDNGKIVMDSDELFYGLIERETKENQDVFNILLKYVTEYEKLSKTNYSTQEFNKKVLEILSDDDIQTIYKNPLIIDLLQKETFKYHIKNTDLYKARAIDLVRSISNILFHKDKNLKIINATDDFDFSKKYLRKSFEQYKRKVRINYFQTYDITQGLMSEDARVEVKLNIPTINTLNVIQYNETPSNIADLNFDTDKNSPNYTPLVYVNDQGRIIDENGNDLAEAKKYSKGSMGFLVHYENGVPLISWFKNSNDFTQSKLYNDLKHHVYNLILQHLNNLNSDTHDANFSRILNNLLLIFGRNELFSFNNINIVTDSKQNSFVHIYRYDTNTKSKIPIITLYNKYSDQNDSHVIYVYNEKGQHIAIDRLTDKTKPIIGAALGNLFTGAKINRSKNAFNSKNSNKTNTIYRWENGKFIVSLNNKEYIYRNYGDFLISNNAYTVLTKMNEYNSMVNKIIDESRDITIQSKIDDISAANNTPVKNTAVSDYVYDTAENTKRKTVSAKQILELSGASQEQIDILTGESTGVKLISDKVYISSESNKGNMYYNTSEGKIYITPLGAHSMNNNPTNTIRLILHENIHRIFSLKHRNFDKQKVLNDIFDLYNYTISKLEEDIAKSNNEVYNKLHTLLTETLGQYKDNPQLLAEEFLAESLTQPALVKYLNETEYKEPVNISGIEIKNKSIFQKILDVIFELFGIKGKINDNSILAKEYLVLSNLRPNIINSNNLFNTSSKSDSTDTVNTPINDKKISNDSTNKNIPNNKSNKQTNTVNNSNEANESSPLQGTTNDSTTSSETNTNKPNLAKLNVATQQVNDIATVFESRIKRSDNFETDHIYYMDGQPVDTSVTQAIHGKQDLGEIGIPASALGNTVDNFARLYFEYHGNIPESITFDNLTKKNIDDLYTSCVRIKEYLDKKFGAGRYNVITKEFPIGGIIHKDGKNQTIAGTMDMIVCNDKGEIFIYDFKTKRIGNGNVTIEGDSLDSYSEQVNIYRQILEENFPELKGRINIGGLILFNLDYPSSSDTIKYKKEGNKLFISQNGGKDFMNIENSTKYFAPIIPYDSLYNFISVETQDYKDKISALPKINDNSIATKIETVIADNIESDFENGEFDSSMDLDYDIYNSTKLAISDLIYEPNLTNVEIYNDSVLTNPLNNSTGIELSSSMNEFSNKFGINNKDNIQRLINDNELNYTCK